MGDFVSRLRAPWARWFRPLLYRRGVRVMALELAAQLGPDDGDWRTTGATLRESTTGHYPDLGSGRPSSAPHRSSQRDRARHTARPVARLLSF